MSEHTQSQSAASSAAADTSTPADRTHPQSPAPVESEHDLDFVPISEEGREDHTFRAVYTGFDTDFEVDIETLIPASESPHKRGHVEISHPSFNGTKVALYQNLETKVMDDSPVAGTHHE